MKRIDATIYFDTNYHYETIVWVENNATEEEIKEKWRYSEKMYSNSKRSIKNVYYSFT